LLVHLKVAVKLAICRVGGSNDSGIGISPITIGAIPSKFGLPSGAKALKRTVVHLDAVPADIDNAYSPMVELIGDIAATIRLLTPPVSLVAWGSPESLKKRSS
jgi:thiamine pyrophosphate-dependent acetolactate synthase large subunit-like protein